MPRYRYSFCEVFARKLLPSIKLYLANVLVREHGLTQLEASKILGIKQPLVNYAVSGKRKPRYVEVLLEIPEFRRGFEELVKLLVEKRRGFSNSSSLACRLCSLLRSSKQLDRVLEALGYSPEQVHVPGR